MFLLPVLTSTRARVWPACVFCILLQTQLLSLTEDPNESRRVIVQLLLELYELYWDMMLYNEAIKPALVAVSRAVWMVSSHDHVDPVLQALAYSAASYIVIWKQIPAEKSAAFCNNFDPREVSRSPRRRAPPSVTTSTPGRCVFVLQEFVGRSYLPMSRKSAR
eukprot:8169727-Pyramimonas_sp.AAC.1